MVRGVRHASGASFQEEVVGLSLAYTLVTDAPIAQSAEADDLKSSQCGFESHWGYEKRDPFGGLFFRVSRWRETCSGARWLVGNSDHPWATLRHVIG
jgi:hypothetical protein